MGIVMIGRRPRSEKVATTARKTRNPYVVARSNFESLFRNQAKEKHAWKFAAIAELAIIITMVVAYIQLASSSRVIPYVVEVDRLDRRWRSVRPSRSRRPISG